MADPFRGLFILIVYSFSYCVDGEIRCYCNESGCVTTGYMCKSQLGMCYSLAKYKDDTVVSGCADTIQREPRIRTCAEQGILNSEIDESENGTNIDGVEINEIVVVEAAKGHDSTKHIGVDITEPVLTCCTQDMCNYRDSYELSIVIDSKSHDQDGGKGFGAHKDGVSSKKTHGELKPRKDMWFKAAVIAVPIAGGFILVILVLIAVRMLRTDSRHRKRLIRHDRNFAKAQFYITDTHFLDKENSSFACDSHSSKQSAVHSHSSKQSAVHSHSSKQSAVHSHSSKQNAVHIYSSKQSAAHSHNVVDSRDHFCCQNHFHPRNLKCHQHRHKYVHPKVTKTAHGYSYEQIVSQNNETNAGLCEHMCNSTRASPFPSVVIWGNQKLAHSVDDV